MGTLVFSPLAGGLLTGRVRRGQEGDLRRTRMFRHMRGERRLDAVEQIVQVADRAGLTMTHLAVAFAISHPVFDLRDHRPAHDGAASTICSRGSTPCS